MHVGEAVPEYILSILCELYFPSITEDGLRVEKINNVFTVMTSDTRRIWEVVP